MRNSSITTFSLHLSIIIGGGAGLPSPSPGYVTGCTSYSTLHTNEVIIIVLIVDTSIIVIAVLSLITLQGSIDT